MKMRRRLPGLALAALIVLPAGGRADHGDGSGLLRIHFIDVGHGDAIWIQGPADEGSDSGLNILIDGGPDKGRSNRLVKYLEAYRLKRGAMIDYMVLTHPHDDHYPGLTDILDGYDVKNIIDSGYPEEGKKFQDFIKKARAEMVQGRKANFVELRSQPEEALPWAPMEAQILHQDRADLKDMGTGSTRKNNASTVIRLAYGQFSFLLMGDAEGKERDGTPDVARYAERGLLAKFGANGLRSTVLKAAHHGSETGSTLPFLRAVKPEFVVIMAGRKKFGGTFLPDATVLKRYRQVRPDVVLLRTDEGDAEAGLDTTTDADGDDLLMYTDGDSLRAYRAVGPQGRRQWKLVKVLQ